MARLFANVELFLALYICAIYSNYVANMMYLCLLICSMAIKKVGLSDRVLDLLGQCLSRKPNEVKVRPWFRELLDFVFKHSLSNKSW